jgi:hypothetical protein
MNLVLKLNVFLLVGHHLSSISSENLKLQKNIFLFILSTRIIRTSLIQIIEKMYEYEKFRIARHSNLIGIYMNQILFGRTDV